MVKYTDLNYKVKHCDVNPDNFIITSYGLRGHQEKHGTHGFLLAWEGSGKPEPGDDISVIVSEITTADRLTTISRKLGLNPDMIIGTGAVGLTKKNELVLLSYTDPYKNTPPIVLGEISTPIIEKLTENNIETSGKVLIRPDYMNYNQFWSQFATAFVNLYFEKHPNMRKVRLGYKE
ncbi:hypothetical protein HQ529_01900 [Candidatus Woesearchaeota archaeon]|nr:hypothetical protein [Candidatus Woesearchaeota archaeon]